MREEATGVARTGSLVRIRWVDTDITSHQVHTSQKLSLLVYIWGKLSEVRWMVGVCSISIINGGSEGPSHCCYGAHSTHCLMFTTRAAGGQMTSQLTGM